MVSSSFVFLLGHQIQHPFGAHSHVQIPIPGGSDFRHCIGIINPLMDTFVAITLESKSTLSTLQSPLNARSIAWIVSLESASPARENLISSRPYISEIIAKSSWALSRKSWLLQQQITTTLPGFKKWNW
jgi:hypothetical protein